MKKQESKRSGPVASKKVLKTPFKPNISNNKASTSKKLWEKILNNEKSKDILKKSWSSKSPQKEYAQKVRELISKHTSKS